MTIRILRGDCRDVLRTLPDESILIELNPAYTEMAERRIRDDAPLFAEPEKRTVSAMPIAPQQPNVREEWMSPAITEPAE